MRPLRSGVVTCPHDGLIADAVEFRHIGIGELQRGPGDVANSTSTVASEADAKTTG